MAEMMDTWPAGGTYVFNIQITNAAGSGVSNVELIYTAGEGNEFEALYGSIFNGDTVARATYVTIDDGANTVAYMKRPGSNAAATFRNFPTADTEADSNGVAAGARFIVSGPMRLRMVVENVADGQDATFSGVLRLKGGVPTRTTVGAGAETVTVNTERVA